MKLIKDLKNAEISQSSAKNFWDTEVTSGNAPDAGFWDDTNDTGQFVRGKPKIGGKGGNNPPQRDGS